MERFVRQLGKQRGLVKQSMFIYPKRFISLESVSSFPYKFLNQEELLTKNKKKKEENIETMNYLLRDKEFDL